jgi:hypothetical protein
MIFTAALPAMTEELALSTWRRPWPSRAVLSESPHSAPSAPSGSSMSSLIPRTPPSTDLETPPGPAEAGRTLPPEPFRLHVWERWLARWASGEWIQSGRDPGSLHTLLLMWVPSRSVSQQIEKPLLELLSSSPCSLVLRHPHPSRVTFFPLLTNLPPTCKRPTKPYALATAGKKMIMVLPKSKSMLNGAKAKPKVNAILATSTKIAKPARVSRLGAAPLKHDPAVRKGRSLAYQTRVEQIQRQLAEEELADVPRAALELEARECTSAAARLNPACK